MTTLFIGSVKRPLGKTTSLSFGGKQRAAMVSYRMPENNRFYTCRAVFR
jgi:hypothetical protein